MQIIWVIMIFGVCGSCKDAEAAECSRNGTFPSPKSDFGSEVLRKSLEKESFIKAKDPKRLEKETICCEKDQEIGLCRTILGSNQDLEQRSAEIKRNKALFRGFAAISAICAKLSLNSQVVEQAECIFQAVEQSRRLKCRKQEAVLGAVLFIACRRLKEPLSLEEIAAVLQCESRAVSRCYGLIMRVVPQMGDFTSPIAYALRYSVELCYSAAAQQAVQKVAASLLEQGILAGKNPRSIAGAVVYYVGMQYSQRKVTFEELSEVVGMAEITLKSAFREIEMYQKQLRMMLEVD